MIVELQRENGVSIILDIVFWKTSLGGRRKVNGKELIDTTCQVCIVGDTSPTGRELTRTVARLNPKDRYDKTVGKKVALTKAIANLAFLNPVLQCIGINQKRRSMRQHIWNVFHQTFGRPTRRSKCDNK